MSVLVVYKSLSGYTKRYAEWLADELKAECIDISMIQRVEKKNYDFVIFGGSLHAVGINGFSTFRKYIPSIGVDKILIFAVGASPANDEIVDIIRKENFTDTNESKLPLFYLRGGFNFSKLDVKNKLLMRLLQLKLLVKKNRTDEENGMLAAYTNPLDATKKENVAEIVQYVQQINTL